ncbi:MAG: hypothetical protein HC902_08045 [Calothrix sp. SM1_5_4]|nr:hypothetical protein [Calothrix sp. SM1_5_4]
MGEESLVTVVPESPPWAFMLEFVALGRSFDAVIDADERDAQGDRRDQLQEVKSHEAEQHESQRKQNLGFRFLKKLGRVGLNPPADGDERERADHQREQKHQRSHVAHEYRNQSDEERKEAHAEKSEFERESHRLKAMRFVGDQEEHENGHEEE